MPGLPIDGNDAVAVYLTTKQAVDRARRGEGPTLIEAKTYRHGGHHINDPGAYMDQKVLAEWKERDPLKLLRNKIDNKTQMKKIETQVDKDLDEAIEFGKNSPQPSVEEFLAGMRDF
jgi:pyruvate dehydrogenase E1 component alpha subunit